MRDHNYQSRMKNCHVRFTLTVDNEKSLREKKKSPFEIIDWFFLSRRVFSIPFLSKIKKKAFSVESLYHKDSNMVRRFNKVKPCSARLVLGWVTKYEYPVLYKLFFPSFSKAILRTAELPSLCNVVSSIYQLFVPHFAIAVFMCIYLLYRTYK